VPKAESTWQVRVGLAAKDFYLGGWESALTGVRDQILPAFTGESVAVFEEQLIRAGCPGRDATQLTAPFRCQRCGATTGFRRRGRRSRHLRTRLGRLELQVAMVGCRCGHRFAPLLAALGVEPHARCAPGLVRRALELCTELPYRKVAQTLQREAGATLSERSLRRLVRGAAARVHLSWQRRDLGPVRALLIDGTRVRAGSKLGDPHDRGLELNIAVALRGRDRSGRRAVADLELVGATFGRRWKALVPALRGAAATPIAVSDGDQGIVAILNRALPGVPQQICTFHLRDSIDHRLWGDRMPFHARRALARAVGNAVEFAVDADSADRAVAAFVAMAERHHWRNTLGHLRQIGPHHLTTWLRIDPSGELEHTTSLIERLMREVNRRVDPVGVRWSRAGADAIVSLLLARRFGHPHWRRLCHDRGPAKAWAELRLCQ